MDTTRVGAVWRTILKAQRPLRYADIAEAHPEMTNGQRSVVLNVAYRLGYVERAGEPRAFTYAVTPRCNVPHGVQLVEILEATA